MRRKFTAKAANNNHQRVSMGLALQGGGVYGAFTKGALKALLESEIIIGKHADIKAVTGTSAGAMNGLMVAHGLNSSGPRQAIENLDNLWNDVGIDMRNVKRLSPFFRMAAGMTWPNLPFGTMQLSMAMMPKGYIARRLIETLDKAINSEWATAQNGPVKLFINAVKEDPVTKERSQRIFTGKDLTPDAFAAAGSLSAIGPHKIDGVDYYDGGYWRNPCLEDIEHEPISDLMFINIMEAPDRDIAPVHQDDLRHGHLKPGFEVMKSELFHHIEWMSENNKNLNLHVISLNVDKRWDDSSRMNTDPNWLADLESRGYEAMKKWMAEHSHKLGRESSYMSPCPKALEPERKLALA